uniref:G_PROTEIN_RECEP_F1_2 domain-containing protein n=1 Tax=Steinernema glaseri TaxID=37863 RepID=A0A1I8AL79_9BILA
MSPKACFETTIKPKAPCTLNNEQRPGCLFGIMDNIVDQCSSPLDRNFPGMTVLLGVIGNMLVVISVWRHKSLQSVRNMFIVSLSISDIVISVVSGSITPITAFTKVWLFGVQLCYLVPLIQGASLCFSTLTLTSIAIDRFILIIYPTKRAIQQKHAFRMIALNCAVAVLISLPMVFKQALVDYNNFCGRFCTEEWGDDHAGRSTYGTLVFLMQFVLPLTVITFCYMMISLRLGKGMLVKKNCSEKLLTHGSEQRKTALRRRIRTNRMLQAMVGVFCCCWMPSVAFNFLRDYQWLPMFVLRQEYLFGIITHCISMSSTVWNPILYALLNEQFRLAFSSLLASCRSGPDLNRRKSRFDARCERLVSNAFVDGNGATTIPADRRESSVVVRTSEQQDVTSSSL